MKKIFLLLALLAAWQYREDIARIVNPPEPVAATQDVILYATSWCGYCAKTRDLLQREGVPYVEMDIEKSSQGRAEYEALGGGGIPILNVRGTVIRGYDPQAIVALLDATEG